MAWQPISSEVGVKGFKQSCVSNAMDTIDIYIYMLWNGTVKRTGMLEVSVRKIMTLIVTIILTVKGR